MWRLVWSKAEREATHLYLGDLAMSYTSTLIARFMGPTWGPSGADRTQVGPMLVPWTLLSAHGWDPVHWFLLNSHHWNDIHFKDVSQFMCDLGKYVLCRRHVVGLMMNSLWNRIWSNSCETGVPDNMIYSRKWTTEMTLRWISSHPYHTACFEKLLNWQRLG